MDVTTRGHRQPSIWASLVSDDAPGLLDWLVALGFVEDMLIPGDREGAIHHAQLDWPEGGRVMLSSTGERETPCRPGTMSLHVVPADPDVVFARAVALDAPADRPDRLPIARLHSRRPRRQPLDVRDLRWVGVALPETWMLCRRRAGRGSALTGMTG